jgi:ubiquinone/menaquinone biosynthesis C-methylase UbiE
MAFEELKAKQSVIWGNGPYERVSEHLTVAHDHLFRALPPRPGERWLDIATGTGEIARPAARAGAEVTGLDLAPELIETARAKAAAEDLEITFEVGDAEALPYEDASFDTVTSTFGVMFAPDHEQTASELMRVCRPGGRIGLASWTPEGFLGQLFRVLSRHVPPTPGVRSPPLWGASAHLQELFKDAHKIEHALRYFAFRYRSPEHWIEVFRTYYGPVLKAFGTLDADGQRALEADLTALLREADRGGAAGLVVPAAYLETVITV